jgi:membrane protein YqaA with SNARE-associated domain
MRLFSALYNWVMRWAQHRHAPYYLACLSFSESSFFPIPPDVMLAPMALAKPERAWWYAFLTTVTSTLGGVFGYLIGLFFFALIHPYLHRFGYQPAYDQIQQWFNTWGFWVIFVAGFSPLPYKLFTIAAGTLHIHLIPFIIASFIGRGSRFFLVAWLMLWGGEPMERLLKRYIDIVGWAVVVLGIIAYGAYRFL